MGHDFENPWNKKTPKGVVKTMGQLLNSAVFPGIQGGPLEHIIAAKAVAFGEALQPEFKTYAMQVKECCQIGRRTNETRIYHRERWHRQSLNARRLAFKIPRTDRQRGREGTCTSRYYCQQNMVPYDSRSAFQTSGIRLGTPAITTRGVKEDFMIILAELIETVLNDPTSETNIQTVRCKVNEMMKEYPLFAW